MSAGVPLTFGRYEALFHIASGGMAEVFAARLRGPAGFEKLVAVKRLLPDLNSDHFVSMFLDEARLAAQIVSPHVVQTLELGRADDDGALYIVMELVVGVTLFDLCVSAMDTSKELMPIPIVAEILCQAAHGLNDAHEATTPTGNALKVVHRDISPQNLLCGVDGRVRVTDFGIARAVSRSTETQAGQLKGKVAYVSPEQARGKRLDRRSDVFSLGVVAWEALTGKSLFNTGDPVETMDRVLTLKIPSPKALRSDVPDELAKAVLWALERDPSKRCPSAARFAQAVEDAAERASTREVAGFVSRYGGPALHRIQDLIREVERGQERSLIRQLDSANTRIVPEAEVSSSRLIGSPTDAGKSQREIATMEMRPEEIPLDSNGVALSEAPTGRQRRLSAALVVGIVAWVAAAVIIYLSVSEPTTTPTPPLQLETE